MEEIEEGLREYFTIFLKIVWIIFTFFRVTNGTTNGTTKSVPWLHKKRSIENSIECKDFVI
jgi:hypothetical protein